MGCCVSSGVPKENRALGTRSPPVEEEKVKEVLSETRIVPKVDDEVKGSSPAALGPSVAVGNARGNQETKVKNSEEKETVSESSEIFTYSDSLSTAAAAPPEKRDVNYEGGVVDQRPPPRKPRTPAAAARGGGDRVQLLPRKPASPERRTPTPKTGRGRPAAAQSRNAGEEKGVPSKDPGERSGRRSRTPVKRSDSVELGNVTDDKSAATTGTPPKDAAFSGEESLENPVVSLECFIFL